ncbi:cytoplasmic phosphatidylinositol transfer protein 1 [Cimex lectularius]|uniref:Cytoplasmic phosphatidylinositol transfer protein 1 n=1 Tax=Cimex lectularius TaxID=79782 RepID=A0A8I6SC76_CIMLE|nr:cytoplasmic phosphatidylinositol transfer protein 1 [Cimex lectularius]
MVLTKEYRICMPLSVEEYKIGQLYMIARHSLEQTEAGNGVEIIENREHVDPVHGTGRYTEKRIHLNGSLPYWLQAILPRVFYITEKGWNYYPYTVTEYTCSFVPKFNMTIKTSFENNNGCTENCLNLSEEVLQERTVEHIDIAYDEINPKHYKEEEDLKFFKSKKTGRGPLAENWKESTHPIMCSYKVVQTSFEVWGLQTKSEELIQKIMREILALGHRQAFAWIDEWYDMTLEDVREFEKKIHSQTNEKIVQSDPPASPVSPHTPTSKPSTPPIAKSWFDWG